MIPAIGVMIAAYIGLRCLEILCFAQGRYRGSASHSLVMAAALVVLAVAVVCSLDLMLSAGRVSTP